MVKSGEERREFSCCSDADADDVDIPAVALCLEERDAVLLILDGVATEAGSCGGGGKLVIVGLFSDTRYQSVFHRELFAYLYVSVRF